MKEEIKTCAFCGNIPVGPEPADESWWIECDYCEIIMDRNSKSNLIKCWNERISTPGYPETKETIGLIKQWLSLQSRPNERRRYSRCPICGSTWWDDKEQHEFTCWVPMINRIKIGVDESKAVCPVCKSSEGELEDSGMHRNCEG